MKESVKLGVLIDGPAERDAVHVAVAPVTAGEDLQPGVNVGFNPDGTVGIVSPLIGIIDPFLSRGPNKGQRCYVFLYPNTVTSLRHHWEHPAFGVQQLPTMADVVRGERGGGMSEKVTSEAWLRVYAGKMNCYDGPEQAYQRLLDGLQAGNLRSHGRDLSSLDDLYDADELRRHAEVVLGRRIDFGEFTFSCSC